MRLKCFLRVQKIFCNSIYRTNSGSQLWYHLESNFLLSWTCNRVRWRQCSKQFCWLGSRQHCWESPSFSTFYSRFSRWKMKFWLDLWKETKVTKQTDIFIKQKICYVSQKTHCSEMIVKFGSKIRFVFLNFRLKQVINASSTKIVYLYIIKKPYNKTYHIRLFSMCLYESNPIEIEEQFIF